MQFHYKSVQILPGTILVNFEARIYSTYIQPDKIFWQSLDFANISIPPRKVEFPSNSF